MKHIKKCALLLLLSMMLTVIYPFVPTVSSLGEESISAQTLAFPDIVYQFSEDVENFISRRSDLEEDLYTLAFENKDGTNTLKVFTHPVKYVDENGKLKDISNAVKRLADGSYVTAANSIITTFAYKLSDGITISYDDIEINMVPSAPSGLAAVKYFFTGGRASSADNRTVSYDYGSKTTLEYQLTYTGFKEDIVVSEYTGQTEYTFTLNTNGLYLRENDGSFYLADEKGVEKATIGDIIIFTADERNNTFGSMTAKTVTEGEKYELTHPVDGGINNTNKFEPSYAISVMSPGNIASEDAKRMLYEPGMIDIYMLNLKWNPS